MSKAQVERILGPPFHGDEDMLIYKKTVYRYEDGKKPPSIFKNDEVDSKTQISTERKQTDMMFKMMPVAATLMVGLILR
jgi:hypothetical protein